MKKSYFLIIGLVLGLACSSISGLRQFSLRTYKPCLDKYPMNPQVENPIGKVCYRWCKKYRAFGKNQSLKCKEWGMDVKDLTKKEDFIEFRAGNFGLINLDRFYGNR